MIQDKYTVQEVADKLKLSERTILREIKRGNLQPDKAGRRYVFDENEINRYLGKGEGDNTAGRINAFLEEKKVEMVDTVHRFVSVPSFVHDNVAKKDMIELIHGHFNDKNIRNVVFDENKNFALKATAGFSKEAVFLTVPVSVHPVGNKNNWSHPPFDGVVEDGMLFGRGAVAKANAVAMLFALLAVKTHIDEDKFRLELAFDTQNEVGSMQALKTVLATTSNIASGIAGGENKASEIIVGSVGTWTYEISARGEMTASKKANAASKLAELVRYLEEATFPQSRDVRFGDSYLELLSMKSEPNLIGVDNASATIAARTAPSVNKEMVEEVLSGLIDINSDKNNYFTKKMNNGTDGYVLGESERIVQIMKSALESLGSGAPYFKVSEKTTSANLLFANNIPAATYGVSGNESLYDEYVELDSIVRTAKVYSKVVLEWFGL